MTTMPAAEAEHCWNRIGVRGERTCPELERHVHCHNCPVFSRAACLRMESAPPEGYLEELAQHYNPPRDNPCAQARSLLVFRLETEWLGLSPQSVIEVVKDQTIHRIPHARTPVLRGLINFRGELTLCVSLEEVLKLPPRSSPTEESKRARKIMVLSAPQGPLAARVTEVAGIERFQADQGILPPATLVQAPVSCVDRLYPWRDGHVNHLNDSQLFELIARSLS
jgi:chemotaxis-related protein WspD